MKYLIIIAVVVSTLGIIIVTTPYIKTRAAIQLPPSYVTYPPLKDCDPEYPKKQRVQLPHFANSWQLQKDCALYDRDSVTWAIELFYANWVKSFGDRNNKVKNALNNLTIEWSSKTQTVGPIYTLKGKYKKKAEVAGLCLSKYRIWVWVGSQQRLSQTSLIHELIHLALWASTDNPDVDHEGNKEPGWTGGHTKFIKKLNQTLHDNYNL
jgi:hypothetical protein